MGNKQDIPVLKIVTNKASIIAGEPIAGTINLFLPYGLNDMIVMFSLKGKETCTFKLENNPIVQVGKVFVLNFSQVLYNSFGQLVRHGNYSIPFSISTPHSIPGTFELTNKKNKAQVKYSVKATLANQKNEKLAKDKVLILIKQAINMRRISIIGSSEMLVKKCGCLRMGLISLSAHLDKNAYLPGETIVVSINLDNTKGAGKIKKFVTKLIRITKLKSNNRQSIVLRNQIAKKVTKVNIKPGKSLLGDRAVEACIKIEKERQNLELCGTTHGRVIECSYQIEISCFLGFFYSNGPCIDLVVMIFPNEIQQLPPTAPEDWNPVELGQAYMESNEANPYEYIT